ncbi:DUF4326 domain-containing protein [Dermatobacter hominis]|uniref:DUF4326 domain-containing protein n=1 Tax=Dermatobacter hominis TaxID=2884263 RepID=UPI001D1249DD|nr:DUF4326 domain-containing protein [Dermatobacter hominis]UDY36093.1 DUF4326 domain-containing protein [Dermatobacter hominis]
MAERIQLRRAKGWRKPAGALVVARPSKWGNPWKVVELLNGGWTVRRSGRNLTGALSERDARALAAALYEEALLNGDLRCSVDFVQELLGGHDLACWCPLDQPCHADVLLKLANPQSDDRIAMSSS